MQSSPQHRARQQLHKHRFFFFKKRRLPVCHLHVHRESSVRAIDVPVVQWWGFVALTAAARVRFPVSEDIFSGTWYLVWSPRLSALRVDFMTHTAGLYTVHCLLRQKNKKTPTEEAAPITRKAPGGLDRPRNGRGPVGRSCSSVLPLCISNSLWYWTGSIQNDKPNKSDNKWLLWSLQRGPARGCGCQVSRSLIRE